MKEQTQNHTDSSTQCGQTSITTFGDVEVHNNGDGIMNLKIWNDNRSGMLGCMAGNLVLSRIAQEEGLKKEEVVHEKGTIFSTPDKVIVGRICTSDKYLQKDVAHFCNMSVTQTDAVSQQGKKAFFLFITISNTTVHYWLVPGETVEKVMKTLKPKPSSPTCFLRIFNKSGKFLIGGSKDISQYHSTMSMKNRRASRLVRAAENAVTISKSTKNGVNGISGVPVSFVVDGIQYEGTVAPKNEKKEEAIAV